jgi:hypothetical protein
MTALLDFRAPPLARAYPRPALEYDLPQEPVIGPGQEGDLGPDERALGPPPLSSHSASRAQISAALKTKDIAMSIRSLRTFLAAASLAAITALLCVPAVQAMPAAIAAPSILDSASGATVAPGSDLIQTVKKRARTGVKRLQVPRRYRRERV